MRGRNDGREAIKAVETRKEQRRLPLGLGGAALALAAGWGVVAHQALRSASLRVDGAWARVENQLRRRADLLPTLLAIAQERGGEIQRCRGPCGTRPRRPRRP